MFFRFTAVLLLCFSLPAFAVSLSAKGRGISEEEAKREAFATLANSIFVNVKSESSSYIEGSGKRNESIRFSSRSDIPLIGVKIEKRAIGKEIEVEVHLESSKSLSLYESKMDELLLEIETLDQRVSKSSGSDRYTLLMQALTIIEQYEKHRAVAQLLGKTQFKAPLRNRNDIETQLRTLEKLAPSIELAAQVLTKDLMQAEAIYIAPAMPHGSHEVTPFGRVVRDRLAEKINSVESPSKAQTFFKGEYEILDNSIHLTYRLLDISGNTLETRVATLAPSAYKNLQVKPSSLDFDRLLHEGLGETNDFRPQLTTNRGREDVLFDEHEEVELLVKLNRPGYFYVTGHVVKNTENYSYLLELENADSNRRFIRYVSPDDVNKWLSIGRFEASAPFGVESVQLLASADDPIDRLPYHALDRKSELYVTATSAKQGISKTRALKNKIDKNYKGETVLMFTTMAKRSKSGT